MQPKIRALIDTGILQFGMFGDARVPFRLHLEMLPAYPDLLDEIAAEVQALIVPPVERLVCPADAVGLGVAAALRTGIPLVYSLGQGMATVHDLVGAYDIGHPAVLLANVVTAETEQFIASARRVGLEIRLCVAVVDAGYQLRDVEMVSLLKLSDIVNQAELPRGQAQAVLEYLHRVK